MNAKYILMALLIQGGVANAQSNSMGMDSTNISPSGMLAIIPKVNSAVAPTYYAPGRINNSGAATYTPPPPPPSSGGGVYYACGMTQVYGFENIIYCIDP